MFETLRLSFHEIYTDILILLHSSFTVEILPLILVEDPDVFLEGTRLDMIIGLS